MQNRLFLLICFCLCSVLAQVQTTSSVTGNVTDPTGSAVVGAKVTIRNQQTGAARSTVSNATGYYTFPSLVPGTYTVTVSHPGFKEAVVTDRAVLVVQPALVDIRLEVGQVT